MQFDVAEGDLGWMFRREHQRVFRACRLGGAHAVTFDHAPHQPADGGIVVYD
jgi:hypothetical protein